MAYKLELVTDAICVVAESPIWNERDKKLYYVDIQGKRMRTVSLETNEISDMVLPQQIGCLAFDEDNNPICGMEDGIYRINICLLYTSHRNYHSSKSFLSFPIEYSNRFLFPSVLPVLKECQFSEIL